MQVSSKSSSAFGRLIQQELKGHLSHSSLENTPASSKISAWYLGTCKDRREKE
jgi:hypothetical protein